MVWWDGSGKLDSKWLRPQKVIAEQLLGMQQQCYCLLSNESHFKRPV